MKHITFRQKLPADWTVSAEGARRNEGMRHPIKSQGVTVGYGRIVHAEPEYADEAERAADAASAVRLVMEIEDKYAILFGVRGVGEA